MSIEPDTPLDELELPYGQRVQSGGGDAFAIEELPTDGSDCTEWLKIRPYGAVIGLEEAR